MRKLRNSELDRLNVESFRKAEKTPLVLVLDNVRSLHNVGAVFRTADAFLLRKVYLCGITATPPHQAIHKTALGATETVSWEYCANSATLLQDLRNTYQCYAVEQTAGAIPLNQLNLDPARAYAMVFGNEVYGVSQEALNACHGSIEIPQLGTKHSLNIAVSTGIVVWHLWQALYSGK